MNHPPSPSQPQSPRPAASRVPPPAQSRKNSPLHMPITSLDSLPKEVTEALARKNLHTVGDLIYYFPRRYEHRDSLLTVANVISSGRIQENDFAPTIIAQCLRQTSFTFRNRDIRKYVFSDGETEFSISAYNPYQRFKIDAYYMLSGKLKVRGRDLQMTLREYELFDKESFDSIHLGRMVGIYASTEQLTQKRIRTLIEKALSLFANQGLVYALPPDLIQKKNLAPKLQNVHTLHFPDNEQALFSARNQLVYEELFVLGETLARIREGNLLGKDANRYPLREPFDALIEKMPFTLTDDQRQALDEITKDLSSPLTMQRLLHGEVGSGKTLVAALSMYLAHSNGHQSALMAPTEILARQHYQFFKGFFEDLQIPIALLIAAQHESKEAHHLAKHILTNYPNAIIIGTHAMIQEKVSFPNLRYVIIDEQHRFGVNQRQELIEKGEHPDFLSLSATPIPRSLCLTLYGDLAVSQLRSRPQSRLATRTKVLLESNRPHAYKFLKHRVTKYKEQGYVVFPVIEENNSRALRSLKTEFAILKERVFHDVSIGLIHGKLKAAEKESIMQSFYDGKLRVLFSTTVIEVGIDHPNATVIIIESSQQFGLSQLHQLRGRVGRERKPGFCYLITKDDSDPEVVERLQRFTEMQNGFEIAELDLQIRGPGEMTGLRQAGVPTLRLANLVRDEKILLQARSDANQHVFNK